MITTLLTAAIVFVLMEYRATKKEQARIRMRSKTEAMLVEIAAATPNELLEIQEKIRQYLKEA